MNISTQLAEMVKDQLKLQWSMVDVDVQIDTSIHFGDFSTNVCLQLAKLPPFAGEHTATSIAQSITDGISALHPTILERVEVAGPGFINFTISDSYFTALIRRLSRKDFEYRVVTKDPVAIVEYSSPNIAKPFTVGHLRSTIIGDSVARLLSAVGYSVKRDNHIGDWGTQFGKLITALHTLGLGSLQANLDAISSSEKPVSQLVKLYVQFHEMSEKDPSLEVDARAWFTKLESGDPTARSLWQQCVDWSWREFSRIYEELDVTFTENEGKGYGESYFETRMDSVITAVKAAGYLRVGEEGAQLFFFPDEKLPPLMLLKKDGSTLYATRDLATDAFRLEKYGPNILIVNEVGAEQTLYFRQLYRIEELLGWFAAGTRVHVRHGLYRFADGKMSTRKGNVIWLSDVIEEAKKRALALSKTNDLKNAAVVAIGALKWNDLKRSSLLDITFDWDEILSMDGNSGPYLQYTAVRIASILSKAQSTDLAHSADTQVGWDFDTAERAVAAQLLYFETVVMRAAKEYSPHYVATYLYGLAQAYNTLYATTRILGDVHHETKRLELSKATHAVIVTGLDLLGIQVPSEM